MLIAFLPTLFRKSAPVFPHRAEEVSREKASQTQCENVWHVNSEANGHPSIHPPRKTAAMKDPPWAPCNNQKPLADAELMIVTSCKKRRH